MLYTTTSVMPSVWEAAMQYQSESDSDYVQEPLLGLITVSLSSFSIDLSLTAKVEPWCTTKARPDYLISVDSFEFTLQALLEKGLDWGYIYEDYLFPMLSKWQNQGYKVFFVD